MQPRNAPRHNSVARRDAIAMLPTGVRSSIVQDAAWQGNS